MTGGPGPDSARTSQGRAEADPPGLPPWLPVLLAPVVLVCAFTAGLALVAAAFGFYREEMLFVAAGIGVVAALPSILVMYRQARERGVAFRALEDAQARVGGIVESAMDAIIAIDEDQRIALFNAAAENVFQRPREAVLGKKVDVLLPARFHGVHAAHIERFGKTKVTSRSMGAQTVIYGLRANGEEFPIEASISQHMEHRRKIFTVILRDVTARVAADRALESSERRLRGILDSAMDAIITVDESQHVVLFNAAAESVFGWSRDQAMGAPLEAFIPARYRADHQKHVREFGHDGTASRRMGHLRTVRGLRRNGEEFPLDASISHITEEGRHFYTVILRDVSERVRAEEALRRSREEIHELALVASSAREQEKSRIARELHDELGQALTALRIDVSWLREKVAASDPEVAAKLASMQLLLDGTVAASRRISADLRPLMLDDLGLAAATEWLVQNFSNRTGIECDLQAREEDLDLQDPHATAVFRVLQESLTNLAKHAEASKVTVRARREGEEMRLTIEDNGRGFAVEGPRKPGSYGLVGLRERAILLDGDVIVESAAGRGTRIDMRLPLAHVEEPA